MRNLARETLNRLLANFPSKMEVRVLPLSLWKDNTEFRSAASASDIPLVPLECLRCGYLTLLNVDWVNQEMVRFGTIWFSCLACGLTKSLRREECPGLNEALRDRPLILPAGF